MPSSPWTYTRKQRAGLILLLVLLAGAWWLSQWLGPPMTADYSQEDPALLAAADSLRVSRETTRAKSEPESFPFDPNNVSHADLQRLGLSERQATAWIRYREKRPFRSAEDVGRLRVLHPDQVARLQSLAQVTSRQSKGARTSPPPTPEPPVERFPFDPNTISADSLRRLGFSEREAAALLRYRSYRPLTFRRPEDLRRVRALDSNHLKEVIDLVRIALPADAAPAPAAPRPNHDTVTALDINRATIDDWTRLPGIGPYRAERIVQYRDRLGGFADVAQVGASYGLPDSVFAAILPRLTASPIYRPLYINRFDAEELARHPLLKRSTATVIVRYRHNHGPFRSVEDLKKVRALSTETLNELLPYLNFDL